MAPQVLGVLMRRYRQFDLCEDAVQDALLKAAESWTVHGVPDDPRAWLTTVARNRFTDLMRNEIARRRREENYVRASEAIGSSPGALRPDAGGDGDDTFTLLFMCCHPALTTPSQVALTLRSVGGLTTAEIASAFLVPELTMSQRISRAKQRIKASGATFKLPTEGERTDRLNAVLSVLYAVFTEGYTATSGSALYRVDLCTEAIRLTRELTRMLPDEGEVVGLLALMHLIDARRPARTSAGGRLIPLDEQDRTLWNRDGIAEGMRLLHEGIGSSVAGPYLVQASIAALHAEAASTEATDWREILALYTLLEKMAPSPMVTLNKAVAIAMVHGPHAALAALRALDGDRTMADHHRLHAVRAHVFELAGDAERAGECYRLAARRTLSIPEREYLLQKAANIAGTTPGRTRRRMATAG